jgi:hypothetical protein
MNKFDPLHIRDVETRDNGFENYKPNKTIKNEVNMKLIWKIKKQYINRRNVHRHQRKT